MEREFTCICDAFSHNNIDYFKIRIVLYVILLVRKGVYHNFCFRLKNLFTYNTSVNYYIQSLPDFGYFGTVIIERKDGGNILNSTLWHDLTALYGSINATVAYDGSGNSYLYRIYTLWM
jgi:hypothetical protein